MFRNKNMFRKVNGDGRLTLTNPRLDYPLPYLDEDHGERKHTTQDGEA